MRCADRASAHDTVNCRIAEHGVPSVGVARRAIDLRCWVRRERYHPLSMDFLQQWRGWARSLKREAVAMYFAMRDPRTPWYAKVAAGCIVAYALSPIDLIP